MSDVFLDDLKATWQEAAPINAAEADVTVRRVRRRAATSALLEPLSGAASAGCAVWFAGLAVQDQSVVFAGAALAMTISAVAAWRGMQERHRSAKRASAFGGDGFLAATLADLVAYQRFLKRLGFSAAVLAACAIACVFAVWLGLLTAPKGLALAGVWAVAGLATDLWRRKEAATVARTKRRCEEMLDAA